MQTETNVTAPNSTQVTTPDEAAEIDRRLLREVRPAADLLESTDRWLLRVELPGVRIEDVDLEVRNSELWLDAVREGLDPLGTGQASGGIRYRRAFQLSRAVDHEHVSARLERGLLTIELLKSDLVRPRRIAVAG